MQDGGGREVRDPVRGQVRAEVRDRVQDRVQPRLSGGPGHAVRPHRGDQVRQGLRGQVLRHIRGEWLGLSIESIY